MNIQTANLKTTPLRGAMPNGYSVVRMTNTDSVSERARQRLREELHARGISQQELADMLTLMDPTDPWSQPRVGKVLNGKVNMRVDELAMMARCVKMSVTELIRDRGLEFYAELTPTELRILEKIRREPPEGVSAWLWLLRVTPPPKNPATPKHTKRKVGRPRNSTLEKTGHHSPAR